MALISQKYQRALNQAAPNLGDFASDLTGTLLAWGPTSGTPGTSLSVPHGQTDRLGNPVAPTYAHITRGNGYVVSIDATNVVVASSAATQSGQLRVVNMASDNYTGPRKVK
jgi:hypothetical protein